MKKFILAIIAIAAGSLAAMAQDKVSINSVKLQPDAMKSIPLELINEKAYTAFQMDVVLPEGITLANDSAVSLSPNRAHSSHFVDYNEIANGVVRIIAYSTEKAVFQGNSGELLYLSLKADKGMALGVCELKVVDITFTEANAVDNLFEDVATQINVILSYSVEASSADEKMGTVTLVGGGDSVEHGTSVTATATAVLGYEFVNWTMDGEVVSTDNPYVFKVEKDVTIVANFTAKMYELKYVVDGAVIKIDTIAFGDAVTPLAEPVKEGYIFSGWSEIPQTMPAEDVIVTGTFIFDYNTDAYKRLNGQIAELQETLDAAKETINKECKNVAEQFTEQTASIQNSINALTADVKAKYDAIELTADSKIESASIVAAIEKLIVDAKAAQQAYEAEQAKIAANEAAYKKLTQEIADLQNSLDAAKNIIDTECKDVAAQFIEQIANIQSNINAMSADIKAKYDAMELTADSNIDTASVVAAIEKLIVDAKAAQQAYESEQAKIAANEAAYKKLTEQLVELQTSLDSVVAYIDAECKDVAADYAVDIDSIQSVINALQSDIGAKYANVELTAESTIYTADIVAAIETMKEDATEAQKKYEETVGIHGTNANGAKVKAIYSLDGKKVSNFNSNQMYILEYSDGRKVKTIVKK